MSLRVVVPASSANLGPGYDAFGLALGLYDEFEGRLDANWSVEVAGEGGAPASIGSDSPVVRAMASVLEEVGHPALCASVRCTCRIPKARGLGSSAAAIVGGLLLADALVGASLGRRRLLELGARIEGHADNVGAALFGGFVIVGGGVRSPECAPVKPAEGVAALVAVGQRELPTRAARSVVPQSVSCEDAVENARSAALVALGIACGRKAYIEAAGRDRLHEPYRAQLVPDMMQVREILESASGVPAFLSGAGPSMLTLVFAEDEHGALEQATRLAESVRPALESISGRRALALPVDRRGAYIEGVTADA